MPRKKQPADFDQTLAELETLVTQMEQGDLSLEDAMRTFEQGIRLTRECQSMLDQAEQKIQLLTSAADQEPATFRPFEPEQD